MSNAKDESVRRTLDALAELLTLPGFVECVGAPCLADSNPRDILPGDMIINGGSFQCIFWWMEVETERKGARYESQGQRAPLRLRAKGARYKSQGQRAPLRLRAKGARYKSQGQARSASPLVSDNKKSGPALKARNTYFGLSGLNRVLVFVTRGDALRACPWLSYLAPLARRQRREGKARSERNSIDLHQRSYFPAFAACEGKLQFHVVNIAPALNFNRLCLLISPIGWPLCFE